MHSIWLYFEALIRKVAGYSLTFCGACLLYPGFAVHKHVVKRNLPPAGGIVQMVGWQFYRILFMLLSPMMIFLGGFLLVNGLKLKTIPAEKLLQIRKRKPVLYLRSFTLDTHRKVVSLRQRFTDYSEDIKARTQEEILASVLRRIGPCIAVSDPQKEEVVLGFSRLKLGDDWRVRMEDLIKEAGLVVHCAGGTPGLIWELEKIVELVDRKKLLLLITVTVPDEWWQKAEELLGVSRSDIPIGGSEFSYRALIYFDEEGKPHHDLIYVVDGKSFRTYLEDALDPVMLQMKIRPRPKIIRWVSDHPHLVVLVFAALFLFLLIMRSYMR